MAITVAAIAATNNNNATRSIAWHLRAHIYIFTLVHVATLSPLVNTPIILLMLIGDSFALAHEFVGV